MRVRGFANSRKPRPKRKVGKGFSRISPGQGGILKAVTTLVRVAIVPESTGFTRDLCFSRRHFLAFQPVNIANRSSTTKHPTESFVQRTLQALRELRTGNRPFSGRKTGLTH
jgi:hypothetical protein